MGLIFKLFLVAVFVVELWYFSTFKDPAISDAFGLIGALVIGFLLAHKYRKEGFI